jgi:transglutaminase/protease-like cytokinesis protein 3
MRYLLIIITFLIYIPQGISQFSNTDFEKIDALIINLGPLEKSNVATIADTITESFPDKISKARAIYSWIAHYIEIDSKAAKSNDNKASTPESTIQNRKATPLGFATLFQEMCSDEDIRCLTVDGYLKYKTDDINNQPEESNYTWNVVQLGSSPSQWYYVDAYKASGYLDMKQTIFTRKFSGNYFFPNKRTFNLEHFPDNMAWLLGEGPKNIKEFYSYPLIENGAYQFELNKFSPLIGFQNIKLNSSVSFNFNINKSTSFTNISVIMGEGSKQKSPERVNPSINGNEINFTYKFKSEVSAPLKITIDGQAVLTYFIEVEE